MHPRSTTKTTIAETVEVEYCYSNGYLSQIQRTDSEDDTQTYSLTYDVFGKVTNLSVGARNLATYTYGDYNGYLTNLTYGNGMSIGYTYDLLGRVTQISKSNGGSVYLYYNSEGQLSRISSIFSGTTYYTYDTLGRLIGSYQAGTKLRSAYLYDEDNRLTEWNYRISGWSDAGESYTYNEDETDDISDGMLTSMEMVNGSSISLEYDGLQRLNTKWIGTQLVEDYLYTNGSETNQKSYQVNGKMVTLAAGAGGYMKSFILYTYDSNGNILTASDQVAGTTITYTYDNQNQLLGAVHSTGRTETYTYDTVGNLLTFNNGTSSHTYTYGDSDWKDLLTAVDGVALTYDGAGNPTSYYNGTSYTLSWFEGRHLLRVTIGEDATQYQYDPDGLRYIKYNADGTRVRYMIAEGRTIGERHYDADGNVTLNMRYIFDENGTVCGYSTSTDGTSWTDYYFVRNLQGDVLQVIRVADGVTAAVYTYDSWGNILSATGEQAEVNPFRYRGYYYDGESGFYYLESRYYDPAIGRFINADVYISTGEGLLGFNMFAYCNNNPVKYKDDAGYKLTTCVDDADPTNDFFDDVTGGGGSGGKASARAASATVASGGKTNTKSILKELIKYVREGDRQGKNIFYQLTNELKIIFRRDVGASAHAIKSAGYTAPVDHYNIEIQRLNSNDKWTHEWTYHIVIDSKGFAIKAFE